MTAIQGKRVFLILLFLVMVRAQVFAAADTGSGSRGSNRVQVMHLSGAEAENLRVSLQSQGVQVVEGVEAAQLYAQAKAQVGLESEIEPSPTDSNSSPEQDPSTDLSTDQSAPRSLDYPRKRYTPRSNAPSFHLRLNWIQHINIGGGNDDLAALVFVVIGLVVVFSFVIYAGTYLYQWTNYGLRKSGWYSLGLGMYGFGNQKEWGGMEAVRFGIGIRDLGFDWGLSAELGQIDSTLATGEGETNLAVTGVYGAAGPVLVYNHGQGQRYYLEFLAGTSEHKEVHVLAKAMAGVRLESNSGWYFGASTGSLMVSLKSSLGLVRNKNPYNWLSGVEFGVGF